MASRRHLLVSAGSLSVLAGCNRPRGGAGVAGPDPGRTGDPVSSVLQVVSAQPAHDGNGARLLRVFPSPAIRHIDPFVMLDDFDVGPPFGFPDHPHRGFEAFTYMIEGAFEHRDNLGNHSLVTAGGIQRFNSGRGARHSEMPGTDRRNRGLQLWVNLPRRLKTMAPEYEERQAGALGAFEAAGLRQRTIVGRGSPVALRTAVHYFDVALAGGAVFRHAIDEGWNTFVYVLEGALALAGTALGRGQGAVLSPGQLVASASAGAPARFAFLSGRPHHEPIIQRGPFVD